MSFPNPLQELQDSSYFHFLMTFQDLSQLYTDTLLNLVFQAMAVHQIPISYQLAVTSF